MKFRFCGDADCPDWVLAEINTLSRLSSIKVKLLSQIVAQGIVEPPINLENVEKLFADSKLDNDVDLRACIACLSFVITSAIRYNCDNNALGSELQQLGLPREHSLSVKKVTADKATEITNKLHQTSLKIKALDEVEVKPELEFNLASMKVKVDGDEKTLFLTPKTVDTLLENLRSVLPNMEELNNYKK